MSENVSENIPEIIETLYRSDSRQILATLIRLLGDFDLAEDGLHDAFSAALEQWTQNGVPHNPRAWLISTGRFKAIDRLRRRARFETPLDSLSEDPEENANTIEELDDNSVEDNRLRLIFTCCHPALAPEARIALTLREVCGLTTEEIARAFLISPSTLAQRIVRAKSKIKEAGIPYEIPSKFELRERLDTVLQVIYLVFNEGYAASSGESLTRANLCSEAIRLGRLLVNLLPEPEAKGLLAMMLLHESRRMARTSHTGDLILLENQDRTVWDRNQIAEGKSLVKESLDTQAIGSYMLQAAISAVHSQAPTVAATDWNQIIGYYDLLVQIIPSPVVELNRAVAVAMRDGPQVGLDRIDAILKRGDLADYHLAYSARADLCRRLGKIAEARAAYEKALRLVHLEPEKRFLEERLAELK